MSRTVSQAVLKALALVDAGGKISAAARETGVSTQALYLALKREGGAKQPLRPEAQAGERSAAEAQAKPKAGERFCSECGQALPADARASAKTCSGACRTARQRRVAKEKKGEALSNINAERAVLGYPPLAHLG